MMSPSVACTRRSPIGRLAGRLPWLLIVAIGGGADPSRPTPRFEGASIPDPPRQGAPWTPPQTKLPRFLVTATAALFEAGMADPRGCSYREVEIGGDRLVKTRAFVLPDRPGGAGRFAVGWDGIVYPAPSVGDEADLEADVRALAEAMRKPKKEAPGGFYAPGRFGRRLLGGPVPAAPEDHSPLKLCVLLRLGRADLAEALFAAGTTWTPDGPRPDLTDYRITFVSLANTWAHAVYPRLIAAHQKGVDGLALDAARRLDAFRKSVEARAEAMGFQQGGPGIGRPASSSYLRGLDLLPALLADQERRAKEPPRGPVPPRGGDPSARVAALIRDFDQIRVVQRMSPGSADPSDSQAVRDVIAEGDAAVGPLIAALESDTRLTRSMTEGRGGGPGHIHPVTDAIFPALRSILKTNRFLDGGYSYAVPEAPAERKRLADAIRAFWEKNRGVPLIERWYRALLDDAAGMDRWLEAARGLVQPNRGDEILARGPLLIVEPVRGAKMMGEPLREGRDPSVSEALARRISEAARLADPASAPDKDLLDACGLASSFAEWDRAASLPILKALMTALRPRSLHVRDGQPSDERYVDLFERFALLRVRAGDREALDEYGSWVKEIRPGSLQHARLEVLEPLWTHPDHPAIASAARAMFLDPDSPWLPLVARQPGRRGSSFEDPIASPLVCVPAFREALLAALADETPIGTAQRAEGGGMRYTLASGTSGGVGVSRTPDPDVHLGVDVPFRACDYVAWKLSSLDGAPECEPYWPEPRRDAAVASAIDYLRRHGRNLSTEPPGDERDSYHERAHLRFPSLGRPATAEDVREARAIFSLEGEGEGEARVAALPSGFPARARWTTLKAFPIDQHLVGGETRRDYLQDGWVWQAEEVRKGGRWERFYGFVGHATIARVPASEIEFPADRFRTGTLPGGLIAQVVPAAPPGTPHAPGRPIVMTLRLRNGLGVDRAAPTEFVRPAADGKPALRRGVNLALTAIVADRDQPARPEDRKPTREARFDPGDASRPLGPTESFEALSLDLNDWFAGLAPGSYQFRMTFAPDSGLGEGGTNEAFFRIGDPEDRPR
jgi:hypothetical protein